MKLMSLENISECDFTSTWPISYPLHRYITYGQLLNEICRVSNVLKGMGVKKGL